MLYEVITLIRRILKPRWKPCKIVVANKYAAIYSKPPNRITSYNVCYTKLLRCNFGMKGICTTFLGVCRIPRVNIR